MRKSARILGQEYGLTAQEMNFVLKEEGFLDGEPGNYTVTEKGETYAIEEDHHRGTGGYSWYNRYWTTRTWDDEIKNEMDITNDRKREIRQAISEAKQKLKESEDEDVAIECDSNNDETTETNSNNDVLVLAVGALILAASTYGIYKAAPYVKRWWDDKAAPRLKKLKNKITGKADEAEEESDSNGKSATTK